MTALEDLTDVGNLSGADDGDYLAYDQTSGLWIPQVPPASGGSSAEWVHNQGTLTYPAGDNGWVHVSDDRAAPLEARHIELINTTPAADAALIHSFEVTSAMVAVGGTAGLEYPANIGLQVNLSAVPVNLSGFITWRTTLVVDGVDRHYITGSVSTGTERTVRSMMCSVAVGETVEIHSWLTNDTNADGMDILLTLAAPIVQGFNYEPATANGDVLSFWATDDPGQAAVATSPDGITMEAVGVTSWPVRYSGQRGATPGSIFSFSSGPTTRGGLWSLLVPFSGAGDGIGQPWVREGVTNNNSSSGDPLLLRCPRFTAYDFWTLQFDTPSEGS